MASQASARGYKMTLEEQKRLGQDAIGITNNPVFKKAREKVNQYLEQQILSCDPDDKNRAQRVILAKQIAKAFFREFEALISNGDVAEFQIREIEKQKRFTVFNRGH